MPCSTSLAERELTAPTFGNGGHELEHGYLGLFEILCIFDISDIGSGSPSVIGASLSRSHRPALPSSGVRAKLSRKVRETLCELELPYVLHNLGKNSARRPEFLARTGKMMVPYIEDPNTCVKMFESRDIVRYLDRTYGA